MSGGEILVVHDFGLQDFSREMRRLSSVSAEQAAHAGEAMAKAIQEVTAPYDDWAPTIRPLTIKQSVKLNRAQRRARENKGRGDRKLR